MVTKYQLLSIIPFFLQVRRSKIHLRCPLENLPQNLSLSNSFERPCGIYSRNSGIKRICFNIFYWSGDQTLELVSKELNHFVGDRVVFPGLGIGDRQVADKFLFMRYLSVSPMPNLEKRLDPPQSDLTPWKLTLSNPVSQQG